MVMATTPLATATALALVGGSLRQSNDYGLGLWGKGRGFGCTWWQIMAAAGGFCERSGLYPSRSCRVALSSWVILPLVWATCLISAGFRLIVLPLALASLVFGCRDQLSLDEAGLLDPVAFVIGGQ